MKTLIILSIAIISTLDLFSLDVHFIYEKSFLSNMYNIGMSSPISCVNKDGSIIILDIGGASFPTILAKIYRNGEFSWNRKLGIYDEFNPDKDFREFKIFKIIQDVYGTNLYFGFERTKSIKNKINFFNFSSFNGEVSNFNSDTSFSLLSTLDNILTYYNQNDGNYYLYHSRYENIIDSNNNYYLRYNLIKSSTNNAIPTNLAICDTFRNNPTLPFFRLNTFNKTSKQINHLNLYYKNKSDSNLTLKYVTFDENLDRIKVDSIALNFQNVPILKGYSTITQIDKKESNDIVIYFNLSQDLNKYLILNIDLDKKTYKYKIIEFNSKFMIAGYETDKSGNWLIAGTKYLATNDSSYVKFAIYKLSPEFEFISSKYWGYGSKSILRGFAKYQDDEFILSGYYLDSLGYTYNYGARFNTSTTTVETQEENNYISFNSNGNQCFIHSDVDSYKVVVNNLLGQELSVNYCENNDYTLDLANFQSGFYIISVLTNEGIKSFKFVK